MYNILSIGRASVCNALLRVTTTSNFGFLKTLKELNGFLKGIEKGLAVQLSSFDQVFGVFRTIDQGSIHPTLTL
jgi:hypothetical protein